MEGFVPILLGGYRERTAIHGIPAGLNFAFFASVHIVRIRYDNPCAADTRCRKEWHSHGGPSVTLINDPYVVKHDVVNNSTS